MKVLLLLAAIAAPAFSQMPGDHPEAACVRQVAVAGFEQWGRGPAAAALAPGSFASLRLLPATKVAFAPPLARTPAPGTFGGSFALHIATAGSYRIALSAGAWIDVIADGKPIASVSHRHAPSCSGIAKIVTFALAPGDYVVQLSEAKADGIMAMAVAGDGVPAGAER